MTPTTRIGLGLSAALVSLGLAFAPAVFAQLSEDRPVGGIEVVGRTGVLGPGRLLIGRKPLGPVVGHVVLGQHHGGVNRQHVGIALDLVDEDLPQVSALRDDELSGHVELAGDRRHPASIVPLGQTMAVPFTWQPRKSSPVTNHFQRTG